MYRRLSLHIAESIQHDTEHQRPHITLACPAHGRLRDYLYIVFVGVRGAKFAIGVAFVVEAALRLSLALHVLLTITA
jgi:hypothetical protein